MCYHLSLGVSEDYERAFEWFSKSAEQGNRYGQRELGVCYETGEGVPEDIDAAVFWYRKSTDQGLEAAIGNLKDLGKWP
ncbi:Sel1 repeat family protein [Polychytrium aggregatum]|uniref:Sel1 repeat family protein n=1 Tax=Polychytrium aggregatum TaxID=110093 RepID=UPI0022FE87F3|nr:Sel1 repeat family protein [Polychytrium aggregatum]KAI9209652.1 Sel1 repeat family protein [Polychytrium aggregatum]